MMMRMVVYSAILGTGGAIKAISESRTLSWTIVGAVNWRWWFSSLSSSTFVMPKMRLMQTLVDKFESHQPRKPGGYACLSRAFNTRKF